MTSRRYLRLVVGMLFQGFKTKDARLKLAYNDIFHRASFRQPSSERSGLYLILTGTFGAFKEFIKPRSHFASNREILVYDAWNDRWDPKNRIYFLESLGFSRDQIAMLNKNTLIHSIGVLDRFLLALILPFSAVAFWIQWSMFKYRKENVAIVQTILIELATLESILSSASFSSVYFFCSYDIDANLSYLVFRNEGVSVTKVPSPNPLKFHFPAVLSDQLILTSAYQLEEFDREIGRSSFIDKVSIWIPENAHLYLPGYLEDELRTYSQKIAFYSSAYWLREALGRIEVSDWAETERSAIRKLARLSSAIGEPLTIYLHPREKLPNQLERVKQYYADILAGHDFRIHSYDLESVTAESFDSSEVVVCPLSTAFFERLFCGFKTFLIKKPGWKEFPIADSPINNVCLELDSEWDRRITGAIGISERKFFESFGLSKYYLNGIDPERLKKAMNHVTL